MSKIKKLLALALVVAMTAGLSIGATVAYLTSEDSDVNVMTLGNVKIEQHEKERVVNPDGTYATIETGRGIGYKLQDFTQAKPLYPSMLQTEAEWDDTGVNLDQLDAGRGAMDVFTNKLAQDKFVFVENIGKSDAFVRTIIAYEAGSVLKDQFSSLIMTSYHFTWEPVDFGIVNIGGNNYYVIEYVYKGYNEGDTHHANGVLPAGEITYNSLAQVYMTSTATNKDVEALDGNKNGTYDILVLSQAVQTAGFSNAQTALDTGFGDVNAANIAVWFNNVAVASDEEVLATSFSYDAASATYKLANDVALVDMSLFSDYTASSAYTVDGDGATVYGIVSDVDEFQWSNNGTIPDMSAIFSSADGAKVTVNDITFTGTMSAIMAGNYVDSSSNWFNTEFNNVNIVDAEVVSFSANIAPALCIYGNMTMNNCNVYGSALSPLDTDPMWPVYDVALVNESVATVTGGKLGSVYTWAKAKLTLNDVEVDSITVRGNMNTKTQYGIYINEGTTVGVLDLSNITNKTKVNITIAEGAEVGAIVANGVTYDSLDAWKNAE